MKALRLNKRVAKNKCKRMILFNEKFSEKYFIDPIDASGDFDERNHSLDKILSEKNYGFRLTEGFNLLNDDDPTYGEENMI